MSVKYVKLIGAPGTGHRYELEQFTVDGVSLGVKQTTLAEVDKRTTVGKLRVNGDVWARVTVDGKYLAVSLPKFLRD